MDILQVTKPYTGEQLLHGKYSQGIKSTQLYGPKNTDISKVSQSKYRFGSLAIMTICLLPAMILLTLLKNIKNDDFFERLNHRKVLDGYI